MKDKKSIKKDILDEFRRLGEGSDYILPQNWLGTQYVSSLSTAERKLLNQAVRELVQKGLVESIGAGAARNLKLTEKGAALIG